ncbi:hypothetical protein ACLKA6_017512 [Drosophila palustris]
MQRLSFQSNKGPAKVARIKPAIPVVTRIFRFKQFCEYAGLPHSSAVADETVRVSLGGARTGDKLLRTQDLSIFLAVVRISFSGLCDSESRGNTSVRSQDSSRHTLRAQDQFQVSGCSHDTHTHTQHRHTSTLGRRARPGAPQPGLRIRIRRGFPTRRTTSPASPGDSGQKLYPSKQLEFLEQVEWSAETYGLDLNLVPRAIPELLKGTALKWYIANNEHWRTWASFVASFQEFFLPRDYFSKLLEVVSRRKQGIDEPFKRYMVEMQTLT